VTTVESGKKRVRQERAGHRNVQPKRASPWRRTGPCTRTRDAEKRQAGRAAGQAGAGRTDPHQ